MSKKLLTIGMATYDDYDGVYFTVQALRLYQLQGIEKDVEIIVIDNNPDSKHGKEIKNFSKWADVKYIPYTEKQSSFVKYEIFKHASGKYTLGMDCHVLFQPDAIKNLLEYYTKNPDTKNLIQGPLWYDDLKNNMSTHFDKVWRGNMYGVWANDKTSLEKNEPFEIPMMGMGAYSCRTEAWPQINKNFIGFGGEEGYIHEKFRQSGGKCICLPNFKWIHRFGRPNGVPFQNILEHRLLNYFIGWLEILKDENHPFFQSLIDAFKNQIQEQVINNIFNQAKQI
jgi:hypothetical protein